MEPAEYAREWVEAWNSHDVERVVSHFSDDVVFTSPAAMLLVEGSDGRVRGKDALCAYWSEGFRRIPDLHFEVIDVYAGVDVLVINYRNQRGGLVNEVLEFDGPLVVRGHGTYAGTDANPTGAR